MVDEELGYEADARRQLASELAERVDTTEPKLIQERGRHATPVINGEDAAIEVDVHRLETAEEAAKKTVAVGVQLDRAGQVKRQAGARRRRFAEPPGNAQRTRAVSLAGKAEGVRVPQHVVRSAEVQPRPKPRA